MLKVGLFVRLEAKNGKEEELAAFLAQGLELANGEAFTPLWLALKFGPSTFAVFDAFANDEGRQSHLRRRNRESLDGQGSGLVSIAPSDRKAGRAGGKTAALRQIAKAASG